MHMRTHGQACKQFSFKSFSLHLAQAHYVTMHPSSRMTIQPAISSPPAFADLSPWEVPAALTTQRCLRQLCNWPEGRCNLYPWFLFAALAHFWQGRPRRCHVRSVTDLLVAILASQLPMGARRGTGFDACKSAVVQAEIHYMGVHLYKETVRSLQLHLVAVSLWEKAQFVAKCLSMLLRRDSRSQTSLVSILAHLAPYH